MSRKQVLSLIFTFMLAATLSFAQATSSGTTKKEKTTSSTEMSSSKGAKIDINSAGKDELMKLPGVGDVTAQKIIDNRPYNAKNDLVRKKIVGQAEYDKIKDQIIAHHAKGASAEKGTKSKSKSQ